MHKTLRCEVYIRDLLKSKIFAQIQELVKNRKIKKQKVLFCPASALANQKIGHMN